MTDNAKLSPELLEQLEPWVESIVDRRMQRYARSSELPARPWMPRFLEHLRDCSGKAYSAWMAFRAEDRKAPAWSTVNKYRRRNSEFGQAWSEIVRDAEKAAKDRDNRLFVW